MKTWKLLMVAGTFAIAGCGPGTGPSCLFAEDDDLYQTECALQENAPITPAPEATPEATEEVETDS